MKRFLLLSFFILHSSLFICQAQGWPANYSGVMLQGFYWDSYTDSSWPTLEKQADELAESFSLIWVPQSGNCDGTSMGYNPKYYFDQKSSFGTEAELRSMISTFKSKGLGTIADVVINHRANLSSWVDFPKETYKGVTYEMVASDICKDDDGGATQKANPNVTLSANDDEGSDWSGMRDLDHKSANVQKCVKAYEDFLVNDLGYTGFRYDMVKGFGGSHVADYNIAAGVKYSVGECWDSNSTIQTWINSTKVNTVPQSAAFDFQFRYQVRDAINNNDWTKVAGSNCLVYSDTYKQFAVTFIENHDTEKRATDAQDPIKKDTIAANAYLLAMPGTPCVFFKHWQAYKKEIKMMIAARKMMGINNQSSYLCYAQNSACTAIAVTGTNGKLIVAVGPNASGYTRDGWKVLMSGYKYKYLVEESFNTSNWDATVKHIEETTKEPETPTFNIPACATAQTGTYAYFEKPSTWGTTINVWAWDTKHNNANAYSGAGWPGTVSQKDLTVVGTNPETNLSVYLWKYSGTGTPNMIIFNDGSKQTSDFTFQNGGYYTNDGLQGNVASSIDAVTCDTPDDNTAWYTLNGLRVNKPTQRGIYFHGNKKYVIK